MRKEPLTTALYKCEIKHSPSKKQTAPHQLVFSTPNCILEWKIRHQIQFLGRELSFSSEERKISSEEFKETSEESNETSEESNHKSEEFFISQGAIRKFLRGDLR